MKKVMVFGTFDGLHRGHLNFLKQAKKYGDYLIAVVARDKNVKRIKGKSPYYNEKERLKELKKNKIIDKAVLGHTFDKCKIILENQPDVICLGYDQDISKTSLQKQLKKMKQKIKIYRMASYKPEIYKSSKLKKH